MKVELLYDEDCPNAETARVALAGALSALKKPVKWTEWERASVEAPAYAHSYGSPTILIDGVDVAGALPDRTANSCRLYGHKQGAPSVAQIQKALCAGASGRTKPGAPDVPVASTKRKPERRNADPG